MDPVTQPVTLMNGDTLSIDYKRPGGTFQLVPAENPKARYAKEKGEFKLISEPGQVMMSKPQDLSKLLYKAKTEPTSAKDFVALVEAIFDKREGAVKVIIPCPHCHQPGAVLTTCRFCGAPIINY